MESRYWVYVYKKKLDQPRRNYKKKKKVSKFNSKSIPNPLLGVCLYDHAPSN